MKGGDKVEGEILEDRVDAYRVRTILGVVDIDKTDIDHIEETPSPWQLYAERRAQCPNSADGHYALAKWCGERGLGAERIEELKTVIAIDPDHAGAREDLGYVRSGVAWVKERTASLPTNQASEARRRASEEERLIRELTAEWFVKVKAMYRGRLAKGDAQAPRFRRGREQILAIRDPLAVPAITSVLSTGNAPARRVMVEALSQFDEDEATMNLLVVTLLDPASDIRKQAATELLRRNDERVVERLRGALGSNEEFILRNAATALGLFKATSAVEDLIAVLSTEERCPVYVERAVMLDTFWVCFARPARYHHGNRTLRYRPNRIGVLAPNTLIGTEGSYEEQTVSIYRTEVQEALIAITGQNMGFDREAWMGWWRAQPRKVEAPAP